MLGAHDWLGVGQAGEGFVALGGQQQPDEIPAKRLVLIELGE
jgi:hypothetical protein